MAHERQHRHAGYRGHTSSVASLGLLSLLFLATEASPIVSPMYDGADCVVCSNTRSPWMIENGYDCETWSLLHLRCDQYANPFIAYWSEEENKFCQKSCYELGLGYEGDDCCGDLIEERATAPAPPTRAPTMPMNRDRPFSWIDYNEVYGAIASRADGLKLDLCQGSCQTDDDCEPGLKCYVRNGGGPVPNCNGNPKWGVDYCVLSDDWETDYKLDWGPNVPTTSPMPPNRDRPFAWIDYNEMDGGDLDLCQGNCNSDSDCQSGLKCYMRNGSGPVPNCNGSPKWGVNYCVLANNWETDYKLVWGPTSSPTSVAPTAYPTKAPTNSIPQLVDVGLNVINLGLCQGDCDSDYDCQPGLKCISRDGSEPVEECLGSPSKGWDYCVIGDNSGPNPELWSPAAIANVELLKVGRSQSSLLLRCQGDCDTDYDCASGLKCMQRTADEPVSECSGTPWYGWDYCVAEGSISENSITTTTAELTNSPTLMPTSSECSQCTDFRTNWMVHSGLSCENVDHQKYCRNDPSGWWAALGICSLSCARAGVGYEGINCCARRGRNSSYEHIPVLGNDKLMLIDDVGRSATDLKMCQGDCDKDSDCQKGLHCMERDAKEPVPGCDGEPRDGWDYCVEDDKSNNQPALTLTTTECTQCDDYMTNWMVYQTESCADIDLHNYCRNDPSGWWDSLKICSRTCALAGVGYPGVNCCTTESPTAAPTTIDIANISADGINLGICEGDCDYDSDCQPGLKCLKRDGDSPVPGCNGTPKYRWDYCVPKDDSQISTESPTASPTPKPASCEICTNDKRTNFMITNDETCEDWPLTAARCNMDYWIDNKFCRKMCNYEGDNCCPSEIADISSNGKNLGLCQGDCDDDSDCVTGMKCHQRNGYQPVPGCTGSPQWGWDYCIPGDGYKYSEVYSGKATKAPTASPTPKPTSCEVCTNDHRTPYLINSFMSCEDWPLAKDRCSTNYWKNNRFCRKMCDYEGDNCCQGDDDAKPVKGVFAVVPRNSACTPCTDNPSPTMVANGLECETWANLSRKCGPEGNGRSYQTNKYCQYTCWYKYTPYTDKQGNSDVCCLDV